MKTISLFSSFLLFALPGFSQTCANPVFPAKGEQLVELKYDKDSVSINQPGQFNGVTVRWNKIPGASGYYLYMNPSFPEGDNYWQPVYPGIITDTIATLPVQYGTTYQWFVSADYATPQPCNPSVVSSFTTVPAPALCKPACNGGGSWSWDQSVYQLKIWSEQKIQDIYVQPCYNYFNNKANLPSFIPGNSYPASYLDIGNTSARNNYWIDFNDNGYWEASELVGTIVSGPQYGEMINSFFIPLSAVPGIHRLRLVPKSNDPCIIGDQSAADFYVQILAPQTKNYLLSENTAKNTCVTVTSSSVLYSNNEWRPLVDQDGKLVAAINPRGNILGTVTVKLYQNSGAIRTLPNNTKVLDRNIEITPQIQPTGPVDVRLYFSEAEFNALKAADNSITDISSINISKFASGCGQALTGYNFIGQTSSGTINGYYYIQFSTTSFSDFYLRGGVDPGLPVHFLSAAVKREGKDVRVIWQTATEQNNKGFEVEYSADGSNFKTLSFVATKANAGNSNAAIAYSFSDLNAPAQVGFYRIKQIDKDGKILYSNILGISAVAGGRLFIARIFPNPTRNNIQVQVNAVSNEAVILELVNSAGVSVLQRQVSLQPGQNSTTISLEAVPTGIYLLHLKDKDGRKLAQAKVSRL